MRAKYEKMLEKERQETSIELETAKRVYENLTSADNEKNAKIKSLEIKLDADDKGIKKLRRELNNANQMRKGN